MHWFELISYCPSNSQQDTPEADFTSFSSIVSCCVETPVRLVAQKLEQVAVDWFRDSLQVLEHLRWLRKLMLMAEGLCMDIFARDFLLGLSPASRVDWGVEDRLSSALTLAMIEGCVPMDAMAQNFHYKSTPLLSQCKQAPGMICKTGLPPAVYGFLTVVTVRWMQF